MSSFFSENSIYRVYLVATVALLGIVLLIFVISKRFLSARKRANIKRKANLYTLGSNTSETDSKVINPLREKVLEYCQDLIDNYKTTRRTSRNTYFILQISTIVLCGITPILILVDKLEIGNQWLNQWLKWLPIICPAVAAVFASVVTSFPLQKNWIAANAAVELLEAEQEKFVLAVTPAYYCYNLQDETQNQKMGQKAIENFIVQINNIHLKRVQEFTEAQAITEKVEQPSVELTSVSS